MSISRHYILAAGGTGGHMMPAYALAAELIARGHRIALVTDDRGARIGGLPDGRCGDGRRTASSATGNNHPP